MNVEEIFNILDKEKTENKYPCYEKLAREFDFECFYTNCEEDSKIQERLKCYSMITWYCTDTYVGMLAYALDGKLVCYSWQFGRKCETEFFFKDEESFCSLRDFIKSFVPEKKPEFSTFEECDLFYSIEFNFQLLRGFHDEAFVVETNERIFIDFSWEKMKNWYSHFSHKVKSIDGRIFDLSNIRFKIPTKE